MTSIKSGAPKSVATPVLPAREDPATPALVEDELRIWQYKDALSDIIGHRPYHELLIKCQGRSAKPLFSSSCIYEARSDIIWTASAPLPVTDPSVFPVVLMSQVKLRFHAHDEAAIAATEWLKMRPPATMPLPHSGAVVQDGILWTSWSQTPGNAGLVVLRPRSAPVELTTRYLDSRWLNSPTGVAAGRDGMVWLSDGGHPGEDQPRDTWLPPGVYLHDRMASETRLLKQGMQPTSLALSPDEKILYVGDAGSYGDGIEPGQYNRAASVYAYDILSGPFLANERLFATPKKGIPTCIKCDRAGNVYVAAGKRLEIWSSSGSLVGAIEAQNIIKSFCFGRHGDIFIAAIENLWRLRTSLDPDKSPIKHDLDVQAF